MKLQLPNMVRTMSMLKKYIKQWIMGSNKELEVKRMTIDEIKSIYFQYDCSLFAMAREDQIAFEQYRALKLPKKIEAEWKKELLTTLFEQLKEIGDIAIFMRIDNIMENFTNKESLIIMKNALNYIRFDNLKQKLCVAESLIGRSDITERSGMIFGAYDLGEKELAAEFMRSTIELLNNEANDDELKYRSESDMDDCIIIDKVLKLGILNDKLEK